MSAMLPYLPPLEAYREDVATTAANAAKKIQAAPTAGGKAGLAVRGALDVGSTAVGPAVRTLYDPLAGARAGVADFGRAVVTGNAPAAAPTVPQVAVPAPIAPINSAALPTLAETPSIIAPATHAAVGPAPAPTLSVRGPVNVGIGQQMDYADAQRAAVLHGAAIAAATGNPDNASYRYAAALHGLPQLSGSNNFAHLQAQGATEAESIAERERANIRTTEQSRYNTDVQSEAVRKHVIAQPIGEYVNPDPATRAFAPLLKTYGYATLGKNGAVEVRDMQGNLQKPAEAPRVAVGVKVTQKDGTYPLEGGKSAVVKGGVVTEIK